MILVPVVLFYLLIDWPLLRAARDRAGAAAPAAERVASFTHDCDVVLGQYLRGQLLVMLMHGRVLQRRPGPVRLRARGAGRRLHRALAIFVPYVGFGIGLLLALLAGVLQFTGWYGPIAVFVVYGIGQIVEGLFLTPKMVGERIGMSR